MNILTEVLLELLQQAKVSEPYKFKVSALRPNPISDTDTIIMDIQWPTLGGPYTQPCFYVHVTEELIIPSQDYHVRPNAPTHFYDLTDPQFDPEKFAMELYPNIVNDAIKSFNEVHRRQHTLMPRAQLA